MTDRQLFDNFLESIERAGHGHTVSIADALRLVGEIRRLRRLQPVTMTSGTWIIKEGQAYRVIDDRYPKIGETVCNSNLEIFKWEVAFPAYRYPILFDPISLSPERL